MIARGYQATAIDATRAHWAAGVRSVCLVAPTGAGKTFLGQELVADAETGLWVAHRRELILQAAGRLEARFGRGAVGIIMPGKPANPWARFQVGTVQTLLARETLPQAARLVLDEAHHYAAEEWRLLARAYGASTTLGLTATPQRQDGEPLGDLFEKLVVAASYSELVADGWLVAARVLQPPKNLGNDLAQDPLEAWAKYAEGSQTIVFCARVDIAYRLAKRFRDHGVLADTVEAETPVRERERILERFQAGKIKVVTNVYALTEGVDIPEARTVMLARSFGFVGGFLQAVGRVLRPSKGKTDAIVIDLCGSTLRHGMPTDDRDYSLLGRPISGEAFEPPTGGGPPTFSQSVKGVELRFAERSAPLVTPVEPIVLNEIPEAERRAEYQRLLSLARAHRMRDGFAAVKYREKFGEEPRMEWRC